MLGLGKPRSILGKWIDKHGVSQTDLCEESGVNKETISDLCKDSERKPQKKTAGRIVAALNRLVPGTNVCARDFWQ
ncbi:helix-turn-helix transcriptional regulator [Tumebacillus sp. DT12]|uniref:Helix-turn-helix transcriptional regulator n=1 Tax=Tumebacillus lacus TaxID=2995335 RepID=A0ABT3X0I3_9BACL|nr:helix-turn-helix transcriptional regulator [Tumebacillus lacus]MCX7570423.1 helix-turn-helix transcriptional regulator [Tumebacillus lacus]